MFIRYGTLTNIELLDETQCNESGMLKTANLATEWKEIVKKSYTQPSFEIQGELDLPNFIYFKARAISAMEKWGNNGNGDAFPGEEIKKAINTFVGKGLYVEHNSDDPEKSVGIIVSAKYLDDPGYAECICAISKSDQPEMCKKIVAGDFGAVSMGCFLKGTPVLLSNGVSVPIEEVEEGTAVISHTGSSQIVVNAMNHNYNGNVYKIGIYGNGGYKIPVTEEHPFYAIVKNKVCACGCGGELSTTSSSTKRAFEKRFITGHYQNVKNTNQASATATVVLEEVEIAPKWIEAKDLVVGDLLLMPIRCDAIDTEITPGKMKLVGYFLAEGNYLKHKGEVSAIQFNLHRNEEMTLAEDIVRLLKDEFGIVGKKYFYELKANSMTVQAYGKEIAQWFYQHCGDYSHSKIISDEIMKASPEKQIDVIAGWLNGDGSFKEYNGKKRLSGCTISYSLMEQLRYIAARCGIRTHLVVDTVKENRHQSYTIGFSNSTISNLISHTKWSSEEVSYPSEKISNKFDNFLTYAVTDIEKEYYDGIVYNLEVANDNSYIAGGVSAHNCICTEAECSVCHNIAHNENELCTHMKPYSDMDKKMPNPHYCKGRSPSYIFPIVASEGNVAYEINRKLVFNELSLVKKPADKDANIYQQTIIASKQEDKMAGDSILDKLSYNDYKNLKKVFSEEDGDLISKIASRIKAELSDTMKSTSEVKPEAVKINAEEKVEDKKEEVKENKEEKKEEGKKEGVVEEAKEVKKEEKEIKKEEKEIKKEENAVKKELVDAEKKLNDIKDDIKEVKKDMKSNPEKVIGEAKELIQKVEDVVSEEKKVEKEEIAIEKGEEGVEKEEEEILKEEGDIAAVEGVDLPPLTDEEQKEIEMSLGNPAGKENEVQLDVAASKKDENLSKEGRIMDLTYIPGKTFDTSYFVASDAEGNRKSVKASLVIPKEIQDKIIKGEPTVAVEDIVSKISATCEDKYEAFEKFASEVGTEGFAKKAYDFFAFKMENAPKAEKGGVAPEMAIDEKEAKEGQEKSTKSAPKTISQYFNRLPGSTAADPEIALNLKSQLDETVKGLEELKKSVAEKDALLAKQGEELKKLATENTVLSKKIKAEDVNAVIGDIKPEGVDINVAKEQLSGLTEAQLNVVKELVKTAKIAEPRKIEASAGNAPQLTNTEKGTESNLEVLITEWSANTDAKNYSNEL